MLEIHGNLSADVGLDLAKAPVGAIRVAHQHAWLEQRIHTKLALYQ